MYLPPSEHLAIDTLSGLFSDMSWAADRIHDLFSKCAKEHVNSNEAMMGLYQQNIPREDFIQHLDNLLRPTYQAAKNQGFTEWHPGII